MVTGNLGFIGMHLASELKKRGILFVGYDLADGNDIRDSQNLDAFFERNQITHVIHMAALAGVRRGEEYPDDYISTNIKGTLNVVRMCEKYKIKHLVSFSSSSVYGNGNPPISEDHPKNPVSIYGMTKLMGEKLVENAKIAQKTIVIPFTVYGENGRKDEVIYKWLEQHKNGLPITIYGDGESIRGYVNVHDLVETVVKLVEEYEGKWSCESFNLGGNEQVRLAELFSVFTDNIKGLKWVMLDMPASDVVCNYADTRKAYNVLGFRPRLMFYENVKKIIKREL